MEKKEIQGYFEEMGGRMVEGFPVIDAKTYKTSGGRYYLRRPGVAVLSKPSAPAIKVLEGFLKGFDGSLQFDDYMADPQELAPAESLSKIAGQACYASFGPKRSKNSEADKYFENIVSSGHGSVLEHANFSFLLYGISRSLSHEWVRHRAGWAYSQLSQRYVSGRVLRFVERPEYQDDEVLHARFEKRIEYFASEYEFLAKYLLGLQVKGKGVLSAQTKTDLRKKVQQVARSVLPNETETLMVTTGNVRALRHVATMRASEHAEVEIREASFRVFICMALLAPSLFRDYEVVDYSDGTRGVKTNYPKV